MSRWDNSQTSARLRPHGTASAPKDLNVLGSWGFTGNDLPLGVDMLSRTRDKYPWLDMQTLYPFTEDGIGRAVADAMAMKMVKSTIVPWPELAE